MKSIFAQLINEGKLTLVVSDSSIIGSGRSHVINGNGRLEESHLKIMISNAPVELLESAVMYLN